MDHATSIVIGETAVIEDDVSLLHEVTLGEPAKRPEIVIRRFDVEFSSVPEPRFLAMLKSVKAPRLELQRCPEECRTALHGGGCPCGRGWQALQFDSRARYGS